MPKNGIAIISAPPVSSGEVARQWLVRFAAICQKEFSPALANIWDEQLRDIEPDLLARACDRLMKKWDTGFLPVPGNVRREADEIKMVEEMQRSEARRREDARLQHERAIAQAEQRRRQELPAPKADAEQKASDTVREIVGEPATPEKRKVFVIPPSAMTPEEQKARLRQLGFLK